MYRTIVAMIFAGLATQAAAETLCPDGWYAPGDSCMLSANGKYVIGGPVTLPPDVWFVEGRSVAVYPLRSDEEYRIGRPQRNRILDAPPGTRAIEIPRLGR
jgi:hypothetical protein